MNKMRYLLLVFVLLCVNLQWVWSQTFDFNTYDSSIGLPQNYVYSVQQDYNGFIWIATAEGVSRYDGISFVNFSERDSLADNFTRVILVDRARQQILFGHNNGSLSLFDGTAFSRLMMPLLPFVVFVPGKMERFGLWNRIMV